MNTSTTTKCTFCAAPALPSDTTDPPACGACGDLIVLCDWMVAHNHPLTVAEVTAQARQVAPAGWTITPGDVARLLPAFLAARVNE